MITLPSKYMLLLLVGLYNNDIEVNQTIVRDFAPTYDVCKQKERWYRDKIKNEMKGKFKLVVLDSDCRPNIMRGYEY